MNQPLRDLKDVEPSEWRPENLPKRKTPITIARPKCEYCEKPLTYDEEISSVDTLTCEKCWEDRR